MKKVLMRVGIFLMVVAAVVSCKDDEDDKPSLGTYTIDGRQHDFTYGAVFTNDSFETNDNETLYPIEFLGSGADGHSFDFEVISSTATLESGTFEFIPNGGDEYWNLPAGAVSYLIVLEGRDDTQHETVTAAKVIVEKIDSEHYTFTVTGTVDGMAVTANFSGWVQTTYAN
jgi:hypothetical protein